MTDIIAAIALISGALMSAMAGIAVLRFPDVMSRIHAATKPQVLGIMLLMLGVGLRIGSASVIGVLVLIVMVQFATAPVSAHLVVRAAHRRTPETERTGAPRSTSPDGAGDSPTTAPESMPHQDGDGAGRR